MHNIHTTADNPVNPEIDISQPPKGGTTQRVFAKPELMIPVRCNNHPWMNAFINVSPNPFYAVSDENGHFEIRGLPPGTYTRRRRPRGAWAADDAGDGRVETDGDG